VVRSDFDDRHHNQFAFSTKAEVMPKPLNLDWAAVRVLAVAVEVREAARQMGISEDATTLEARRLDGLS
jgi:hypothetical protein